MSSNKKCKILILFSDMIADMLSNKKNQPTVPKIFIRSRKTNIYLVLLHSLIFLNQTKNIRLHSTHYITMKIPNKGELEQITINNMSDIDFLKL